MRIFLNKLKHILYRNNHSLRILLKALHISECKPPLSWNIFSKWKYHFPQMVYLCCWISDWEWWKSPGEFTLFISIGYENGSNRSSYNQAWFSSSDPTSGFPLFRYFLSLILGFSIAFVFTGTLDSTAFEFHRVAMANSVDCIPPIFDIERNKL